MPIFILFITIIIINLWLDGLSKNYIYDNVRMLLSNFISKYFVIKYFGLMQEIVTLI